MSNNTISSAKAFVYSILIGGSAVVMPVMAVAASGSETDATDSADPAVTLAPIEVKDNALNAKDLLEQDASSATHTDVSIFDLPATVDSKTDAQMVESGNFHSANAVTRTVGMSAHGTPGAGGLNFTSRGFGSVGIAVDGITTPIAAGTTNYPAMTWGFRRVDVLRGPGSLMYGSGNMGATINFVRKKPSREFGADLLLEVGRYDTGRAGLGVTGPLTETLSFRVDAYAERTHNERELSRAKSQKLTSSLRWEPSRDFTLDFIFDYSNRRPERYFGIPVQDGRVPSAMRENNYNASDSDIHYRDWRYRINAEWRVNEWLTINDSLYHIRSERLWKNIESYDYHPDTKQVERSLYLKIGHDLRQTGNNMALDMELGRHDVALGWIVSHADFTHANNSPYTGPGPGNGHTFVSATNPDHGHWSSPDAFVEDYQSQLMHYALYGEDAWRINEHWLLMAGVRSDWYRFSNEDVNGDDAFDEYDISLEALSWRLGVTYTLSERTSAYVQATSGHDPVDSLLSLDKSAGDFELTKGRQYEIGLKQKLPSDLGEWTLAAYRIKKTDIITKAPDNPRESIQGGERVSRGIELTGRFHVTSAFTLDGNVAYTDSWFDKLWVEQGDSAVSFEGHEPPNVPSITANLWGHYNFGPDWKLSAGVRHGDVRYTSKANELRMPDYTLMDAAIQWDVNEHATLRLNGHNLTNEFYATASYGSRWLIGTGRSYSLTLEMRY